MRRPFTTCAPMLLVVALAPAALFAQTPAAAQARAGSAGEPTKLAFTTEAGLLLSRSRAIRPRSSKSCWPSSGLVRPRPKDAALKAAARRASRCTRLREGAAGGNALYVILFDPADQGCRVRALPAPAEGHDARRAARARDAGIVQEGHRRVRAPATTS